MKKNPMKPRNKISETANRAKDGIIAQSELKRTRNYAFVTYLSYEEIMDYVNKGNIRHYALIRHDMDVIEKDTPDGVLRENKTAHWHLLVTYHNTRTATAVKTDFRNYSQNTMVEPVKDLESAFLYLTHKNAPEKFQYPEELIESDDILFFKGFVNEDEETPNKAFELVMDIIKGKTVLELTRIYGREYVINRNHYEYVAENIREEIRQARKATPAIPETSAFDTECPFPEYYVCDENGEYVEWLYC